MKSLTAQQLNALSGDVLRAAYLVKLEFPSGTLGLNSSNYDITYGGVIYAGAEGFGSITVPSNQPGEVPGLSFTLSAAMPQLKALALDSAGEWPSTTVTLYLALLDGSFNVIMSEQQWKGKGDVMSISGGVENSVINATAESTLIDIVRGNSLSYTQADQDLIYSGDKFYSHILSQSEKPVIWPTKEFFQK